MPPSPPISPAPPRPRPSGRWPAALVSFAVHAALALWVLPHDGPSPSPPTRPPQPTPPAIDVALWTPPPVEIVPPPPVTAALDLKPLPVEVPPPMRRVAPPRTVAPSPRGEGASTPPPSGPAPAAVPPANGLTDPAPLALDADPTAASSDARGAGPGAGATPASAPSGPAPAPGARGGGRDAGAAVYARAVSHRLAAERQYPRVARLQRREGTAWLRLVIDAAGGLATPPEVLRSAGHLALDHEAVRMALAAAPFPPPPPTTPPLAIDVPVEFALGGPARE